MITRPALSAICALWTFAEEHEADAGTFSASLRRELVTLRGLVLIVERDATLEPSGLVRLTDSSTAGYSLLEARWEPSTVRALTTKKERWRFRQQHRANEEPTLTAEAGRLADYGILGAGWSCAGYDPAT